MRYTESFYINMNEFRLKFDKILLNTDFSSVDNDHTAY